MPKQNKNVIWGTGRRKTAVARVQLKSGQGEVTINGKVVEIENNSQTFAPVYLTGNRDKFDFSIKVKGGGSVSSQEAIRHGLARALLAFDETLKTTLRQAGFLTRDDREKERKKYGLKKARRAPQWSKR